MIRALVIGAGPDPKQKIGQLWNEVVTLDMCIEHKPDYLWNLEQRPLPFEDNSFDQIHAYEVLEHIGRQGDFKGFFEEFNEYYRILKPGGQLLGSVPKFDSVWAWGDPGHTRVLSEATFVFLSQKGYKKQIGVTPMSDYRQWCKCDFELTGINNDASDSLYFILNAIKESK